MVPSVPYASDRDVVWYTPKPRLIWVSASRSVHDPMGSDVGEVPSGTELHESTAIL